MSLTRRRFIAISAVAAALPSAVSARPAARRWVGQALGARASIILDHPEAEAIRARCLVEIDRLENILSLYRRDSALSRLNREGRLDAPPFELLECLSMAGAVNRGSGGLFDVTVQPLWALWAEAGSAGRRPTSAERRSALAFVGWNRVRMSEDIILLEPGMAITLNGIGQGYVADRIAALLEAEGLTEVLIDTGEFRAIGGGPDGAPWPVRIADGGTKVALSQRALATSSPLGTCFDVAGLDGHILDPSTGAPVSRSWKSVTISASSAALADALSTAACLTTSDLAMKLLLAEFPETVAEDVILTV